MKYYWGDFNYLKLFLGSIGSLLIIGSLFSKNLNSYFWTISIGWFLIGYSLVLKRYSENILDIESTKTWKILISYVLIIMGSMLLKNYRLHRKIKINKNKEYTLMLFLGVIFYILSKAILIVVELNLTHYTQYLTILALTSLSIGKIINSITSGNLLFKLSLAYYIIGFMAFIFNLSYNPDEKTRSIKLKSSQDF